MKFHVPTKIFFEAGAIDKLRETIQKDFKTSNVILVTDEGIMNTKIADKVIQQFGKIQIFDEIEQNPKSSTVNR